MRRLSYDDLQRLATLLTCVQCGASYFVTRPREGFVCVNCEEKATKQATRAGERSRATDIGIYRADRTGNS